MKELISQSMDCLDELLLNRIEYISKVASRINDERIKTAYIPSSTEQENLEDDQVALILFDRHSGAIKKFANFTPELTLLNMQVLSDKLDKLPEEILKVAGANLTAAAKEFKLPIPAKLEKYASQKFVDNVVDINRIEATKFFIKKAQLKQKRYKVKYKELPNTSFALQEQRRYPIPDDFHIKLASEYFIYYHKNMPLEDRIEFACNLKKVGGDNGWIEKYSSYDHTRFNDDFKNHIGARKRFTDGQGDIGLYDELEKVAEEYGPLKTAALLEAIDSKLGANKGYGKYLAEPLDAVLGEIEKRAQIELDGRIIGQNFINDLASIDDLDNMVDVYTIQELKGPDGIAVFSSLPLPIREMLYQALEGKNR